MGGWWRRERGFQGDKEGEMGGAVAIRKGLQENRGSSNHRGAISNAFRVTVHFPWKVGC